MVNQRGQAFSVFELMIAGVVAFAILIILLMVIGGVSLTSSQDAKTVIANAISSAKPSGTTTTQDFILKKADNIATEDLVEKTGLDARSMLFESGQFGAGTNPNTSVVVKDGTYVEYTGSFDLKLRAKVICKQTANSLSTALGLLDTSKYKVDDLDPTDETNGCGTEYQPCCAVVLERSTK